MYLQGCQTFLGLSLQFLYEMVTELHQDLLFGFFGIFFLIWFFEFFGQTNVDCDFWKNKRLSIYDVLDWRSHKKLWQKFFIAYFFVKLRNKYERSKNPKLFCGIVYGQPVRHSNRSVQWNERLFDGNCILGILGTPQNCSSKCKNQTWTKPAIKYVKLSNLNADRDNFIQNNKCFFKLNFENILLIQITFIVVK